MTLARTRCDGVAKEEFAVRCVPERDSNDSMRRNVMNALPLGHAANTVLHILS